MATSYKIEVTEIVEEHEERREYQKVADSGNPRDGGAVYDYVPLVRFVTKEREILKLQVQKIELGAVIDAALGRITQVTCQTEFDVPDGAPPIAPAGAEETAF